MSTNNTIEEILLGCSKCKQKKPIGEFRKRSGRSENGERKGRWSSCKACETIYRTSENGRKNAKLRNREFKVRLRKNNLAELRRREREYNLKKQYGFGIEEYNELFIKHGGVCAICKRPPINGRGKKLHVDHDHKTGKIRGLLCGNCNTSLGKFNDDPNLLLNAIKYLEAHSQEQDMTQKFGGSFAPPLSDETLASYKTLAESLPAQSPVRDAMLKLHSCCSQWWELPESVTPGRKHASGVGTIIHLDDANKTALWEAIPWTHELEAFKVLFDTIDPVAQRDLRNAAHHLLWTVIELDLDREPLTNDKL